MLDFPASHFQFIDTDADRGNQICRDGNDTLFYTEVELETEPVLISPTLHYRQTIKVPMEISNLLRHRIIDNLLTQQPEKMADVAITLWEQMAAQIIAIVGEGGFNSLYMRSVFLCQADYPWLAASSTMHENLGFTNLRACFTEQSSVQTQQANALLLITFTDILAALIGEQLTTSILNSAWGNIASDGSDKEYKIE